MLKSIGRAIAIVGFEAVILAVTLVVGYHLAQIIGVLGQ